MRSRKRFMLFITKHTGWYSSFTPVSYTHLDVYKRQILKKKPQAETQGRQVRAAKPKAGLSFSERKRPVSYTHSKSPRRGHWNTAGREAPAATTPAMSASGRPIPVSYTHLDVYKRQVFWYWYIRHGMRSFPAR